MAVLVTGATGLIGRALMKNLIDDDKPIHALSRDPSRAAAAVGRRQIRWFGWDPAVNEIPEAALADVDTIFHLMGEPIGGRWNTRKLAALVASRITSAEKLALAVKGRLCRLICASSFAVYSGERGTIYDEASALPPPVNKAQEILQAAEQAATTAITARTHVNLVRFGLVCSKEGYPIKLARLFRKGFGVVVGDGEQIVPIVDLDDAIAMLRWIASGDAGEGPVNCVAPVLPRQKDIAQLVAAHLNCRTSFAVPAWLARHALGGSADYFLLSYELWPRKAIDRGYNFRHSNPLDILRRALG